MSPMLRSLPVLLALTTTGCVLAPGQSVSPPSTFSREDAQVEVLPITSKLVSQQFASSEERVRVPQALLDYVPPTYRIGAGDVVAVTIWNQPELMLSATTVNLEAVGRTVRPDGSMFYPYAGNVQVAGLTLEEARQLLTQRLVRYIQSPQLDVTVLKYNSQKVYLGGAFRAAQPLEITSVPLSLTEAIGRGGISTGEADLSGLVLKRDGVSYPLNLEAIGLQSQVAASIRLKPNDEIYIPYNDRRKVFVLGELVRQQALPFKTTGISLADALSSVGGLRQETSKSEAVYVIRDTSPDGRKGAVTTIYSLDADSPTALALSSSFLLQPADIVYVGPAKITRWNRFVSQLFPLASLLNTASDIRADNR